LAGQPEICRLLHVPYVEIYYFLVDCGCVGLLPKKRALRDFLAGVGFCGRASSGRSRRSELTVEVMAPPWQVALKRRTFKGTTHLLNRNMRQPQDPGAKAVPGHPGEKS